MMKKMIWIMFFLVLCSGCEWKVSDDEKIHEITVFAAASLTESLKEAVEKFEQENQDVEVNLHLASTSRLRLQIEQGVKADLFLSASEKHYNVLEEKGWIIEGKHFLSNRMSLIVPKDNPAQIHKVKDLQKNCKIILAQREVPAGRYAREIIHSFGKTFEEKVLSHVVSEEMNVKQVVNKVAMGEGDAALVYSSDLTENIQEKVKEISIPPKHNIHATYWIGQLKQEKKNPYAKELYIFLTSEKSKEIFKKYGFQVQ